MLTIEDLKNVRRQKLRVEALQERIERLRSRAEYTAHMLGECGQGDPTRDRLAEYVAGLDELERELTGEMIVLEKILVSVNKELMKFAPSKEEILRLRYCEGKPWDEVAMKTSYCIRQCQRIGKTLDDN